MFDKLCLLFFIFVVGVFSDYSASSLTSCNCTAYDQPFQSLVKRRNRRGIIFPGTSSILVTQAITKVMTGATPRGLSVSYELDMYFPLPDTLEGLYPNKLKKSFLKPKSDSNLLTLMNNKSYGNFRNKEVAINTLLGKLYFWLYSFEILLALNIQLLQGRHSRKKLPFS